MPITVLFQKGIESILCQVFLFRDRLVAHGTNVSCFDGGKEIQNSREK